MTSCVRNHVLHRRGRPNKAWQWIKCHRAVCVDRVGALIRNRQSCQVATRIHSRRCCTQLHCARNQCRRRCHRVITEYGNRLIRVIRTCRCVIHRYWWCWHNWGECRTCRLTRNVRDAILNWRLSSLCCICISYKSNHAR